MLRSRSPIASSLFILLVSSAQAGGPRDVALAEAQISPSRARANLEVLAGERLEGRAAGSRGGRAAAEFIVEQLTSAGLKPGAGTVEKPSFYQEFNKDGVACRNVVAIREGSSARLSDEYVLVGAHYDHVGFGESGNGLPTLPEIEDRLQGRTPHRIHYGADDNGSGTVALLEVARALKALEPAPARTVILVFFDGEERGLWGSHHYVAHPVRPLAQCAAMINMDMVGRSRGDEVEVLSPNSGAGLDRAVLDEDRGVGLHVDIEPYMVPNSDHYSFYMKKVPVVFLFTGLHGDYHRPSDTVDRINFDGLAKVARLCFRTAVHVAGSPARPVYVEVPAVPPGALFLEFAYGFTSMDLLLRMQKELYGPVGGIFVRGALGGGLVVDYVLPDSPLDLAPGDRILEANGRKVDGLFARAALRAALDGATKDAPSHADLLVERSGRTFHAGLAKRGGRPAPHAPRAKRERTLF